MNKADLHVIAEIVAKPGSEDALRALIVPFAESVKSEPGCKHYHLLESHAQPGHFMTIEAWTDQAALDAHMQTPQMAAAAAQLPDLLAKPLVITPLSLLT